MKGIYWLGLLGIASFQAFFINPCFAQSSNIIPDNSLGAESSQVDENFQGLPPAFSRDKIETITGGAQRGINLFHSFQEFNVSEGRGTYFFSPNAEIQNILTRVTGRNPSEILGTLGTFGNSQPNFFLINPNGIVFGENASLDVGGSFVATTANGINLGETGLFSATEPEKSNLLSVNPSALFFNAVNNQAAIQNDSIAPAGTNPAGGNAFGLRVADGKSLLLVGGNVSMDRGRLNAYGGRVELGGLAAPGNVNLLSDGDNLKLGFPENATRSDVSLTNRAFVRVEADGGGDIAINSRNLDILQGSKLFAGIGRGLGTPETVAGDITLNATGEINVAGAGSIVRNFVRSGSQGNGGNITIDSGLFLLGEGGVLGASSFGKGNAGNVTVSAKDAISLRGNAAILSTVEASGVGDGGNIDINASTLSLTDGAGLATSISGVGNAGNIKVTATETVSLAGYPTVIYSGVEAEGEGQSGNIDINTATLSLTEGTELSASTRGMGNAGNIKVTATEAISLMDGNIISTVEAGGVGQGGNIDINAATLSLADSAQLITITRGASDTQPPGRGNAGNVNVRVTGLVDIAGVKNGLSSGILSFVGSGTKGKGGNITVDSGSLSLRNGAQLGASTRGMGDAGNVRVNTLGAVSLVSNAYILSTVEAGGDGQGGDIDINAATLSLTDSAQLLTITRSASDNQLAGRGNAGNVNVKVTGLVNIAGKKGIFASGIFSSVGTGTVGNGGNITVDSGSFLLRDGARIEASTFGMGDAGNVKVNTPGAVSLAGQPTGIFSTVEVGGKGRGGNIDINAATLSLTDGAQLQTITRSASDNQLAGQGDAGNVNVKATGSVNIAGKKDVFASGIFSSVGTGTVGNGGNITVDSGSFSLRDGASVAASTLGQGSAGNVKVNALDAVSLAGNVNIFSTVEAGGKGKGGNIDINAATLSLTDGAQLQTITRSAFNTQAVGRGDAGSVNVKVTGLVDIAGEKNGSFSGIFSFVDTGAEGNGGSITIDSGSFLLRDGAYLQASTYGIGNAGNVTFNTGNAVSLAGNVNIFSTVEAGGKGKGGNIDINAATLSLADGAQLLTLTREASDTQPPGQGDAGNVNVKVTGSVDIAGVKNGTFSAIFSSVGAGTVGNGGNITIDSGSFSLRDGAQLIASTFGIGDAGDVKVTAKDTNISSNSGLFVNSIGSGNTGNIEVNSPQVTLDNGGKLNANSTSGNGGNINLTSDLLLMRRGAQISTNAGTAEKGGDGGDIDINSKFIVALPQENSDITANAFSGSGGNVNILSQGIFGIEPRQQQNDATSDITASSELGVPGVLNLTDPDDSSIRNNLDDLPDNQIDTNALIANSCISRSTKRQENSFQITGSGGLRNSPGDGFISEYSTGDVRGVEGNIQPNSRAWKKGDRIIEPQGLYKLPDGRLLLSRAC